MIDERVSMYVTAAEAAEQVDKLLLDPAIRERRDAEEKARENMQGAMSLGLPIVGMPRG